tara:strand:- start:102 stop:311 length:210 start_codon:yes stop_codon:yes gene_type:complete
MWIKAYSGCLYVVVLGSERAPEPALFSAPIGVAVGGDSGQLTGGNTSSYPRDGVGTTATPIIYLTSRNP